MLTILHIIVWNCINITLHAVYINTETFLLMYLKHFWLESTLYNIYK